MPIFYQAIKAKAISTIMYIYPKGVHRFYLIHIGTHLMSLHVCLNKFRV